MEKPQPEAHQPPPGLNAAIIPAAPEDARVLRTACRERILAQAR